MIRAIFLLGFILFVLGTWLILISRYPRPWRKVYQDIFEGDRKPSVNRNKRIDERLMKEGMIVGIGLLFAAILCPLVGLGIKPFLPEPTPEENAQEAAVEAALQDQFEAMEARRLEEERKKAQPGVPPPDPED